MQLFEKGAIVMKLECQTSVQLVRGWTVSRFEQFETTPETIEQELRPAVC